jgi:perosamine synthetase
MIIKNLEKTENTQFDIMEEGKNTIPLCVPCIEGNEWKYIKDCLDTNWVSSVGNYVDRFETMIADYIGCAYGVATVNGTAALHIALLVAGIKPDDEVLVSTLTFIAPANAIRYCNAWPVFIDADPDYWQMDPLLVNKFLEEDCERRDGVTYNKKTKRRVSAILPVHILGHPVDMDPLLDLAHRYNLIVIEDASESLGAKYKGRMVGSLGDIACFSFNGNKIISTGGGGMVITDNKEWAEKAKYLTTQAKDDPIEYIHNEIGYNYRLPNILAAMGCAQMEKIDEYVEKKRLIAQIYNSFLAHISGLVTIREAPFGYSTYWLYSIYIDKKKYGRTSRELLQVLYEEGVQTRSLWQPLHRNQVYQGSIIIGGNISENLYQNALSLPSSVGLLFEEQKVVIGAIKRQHLQSFINFN